MATSEKKLADLRQQILEAFPQAAPPTETITPHQCWECDAVRDAFNGVQWWSVEERLIDENVGALSLFSPQAFHYYLPAYLLRSLETFDSDSSVLGATVYSLSPTKTPADDPWYREILGRFTPEHAAVIAGFLDCVLEDEELYLQYADAERGLRKFWRATQSNTAK